MNLAEWLIGKTQDGKLLWDFQETPAGGVFYTKGVAGYTFICTANYICMRKHEYVKQNNGWSYVVDEQLDYLYEGYWANFLYLEIHDERFYICIPGEEVESLVADALSDRKMMHKMANKVRLEEELSEEDKDNIVKLWCEETKSPVFTKGVMLSMQMDAEGRELLEE